MSKRLKVKITLLIAVVVAGMVAMGITISTMQNNLSLESYTQEMKQQAEELPGLLKQATTDTEQNIDNYDAIYQSKAQSVAFMAQNNAGYEATNAKMVEYQDLFNVDNIMIVDRNGAVVAQAEDTKANFASSRFNLLRGVFNTNAASEAVEIDLPEENWNDRYYSAKVDDNTMVVIEQNPEEVDKLVEDSGSTASILQHLTVGQHGYVFAVSAKDYLIEYHPDEMLVGVDALDKGIDVADLESGNYSWMKLGGESLYCGVTQIDDMYYIAAVPESDMAASRNVTTGVILFAFFVVMAMVALYGVCVLCDNERRGNEEKDFALVGKFRMNKAIAKKGAVLSLVGFVAVVAIAFYMQTLFALSSESISNTDSATELEQTIQRTDDHADALRGQYDERYLNKIEVAAYILDRNPALATKADLQRLGEVLQVQYLYVFDAQGNMVATSSSYVNFTLSDDPSDQSYEFRQLLQGVDSVVQDARPDEVSGEMRQYIGVGLHDAEGNANGFAQASIHPDRLQALVDSVKIENVLDGVKVGSDGFAFAVNKNDNTIAYYPESKIQGKDALSVGMTEKQLKDGFNDYLTIAGKSYYAASVESGDYYLYVVGGEGELMAERGPLTLATALISLICQALIFLLLAFERKDAVYAQKAAVGSDSRMFDVKLPGGRVIKTESVTSRWLHKSFKWHEKTPEQKVVDAMRVMAAVSVLAIFVAVVFKDQIFGPDSLFAYILNGEWERGLNIFAVTASIMFACVAVTVATVVQRLLILLAGVLGSRGETVCRLMGSFIKYATIIGMVYYCLALLGVDTTTLLASAGILSIAISFGAKELVADILSGLFIIFEGEFRVGDIIEVDNWRGTVVEIGVRTTKVMDASQNIKVIRNSNVNDVVNMTKQSSYTWCDVGIEYSESLERVESILAKELSHIREEIPAIISGPFYKGVVSLGDSSVNIRIMVQCAESDRFQVERDLNREIKLLFDRYDIGIPFPQIVLNKPLDKRLATDEERQEASRFNREQREASKDLEVEDGDERN